MSADDRKRTVWPRMTFRGYWWGYLEELPTLEARMRLNTAILRYGLEGEDPEGLNVEDRAFFNETVKPDIDRQHAAIYRRIIKRQRR